MKSNIIYLFLLISIFVGKLHSQVNCNSDWKLKLFKATSDEAQHPTISLNVDPGYKILGGGATLNFTAGKGGAGALLTESFPKSESEWIASGKDHKFAFKTTITAYAIAIYDPNNCWDIIINSNMGEKSSSPESSVTLSDDGYIMTGGGGRITYSGAGNLLVSSYPSDSRTWNVSGKDHLIGSSHAFATAYVIGIKPALGNNAYFENIIMKDIGNYSNYASSSIKISQGYLICGGGSSTIFGGPGLLIYKSYPDIDSNIWLSACKDHGDPDNGIVTSYAIGLKLAK